MNDKKTFDTMIFSSGSIVKRGYSYALANVGKTVAIITSIAVLLVTFGEVGFIDFGSRGATAAILVMVAASYIIYFSLHDAGEGAGRDTDVYRSAE